MRTMILTTMLFSVACGDEPAVEPFSATGPLGLDDALAYFDAASASLVVVDPSGRGGPDGHKRLARLDAGVAPVLARSAIRPDDPARSQVLVVDPGNEQVLVIQDKLGATVRLSIGVPLEALDVSRDGRYGLAYQPDGATPSRSLFAFPNTVAVLDLDPRAPSAIALRLGTPGARPHRAVFAEAVRLRTTVDHEGTPTSYTAEVPLALVFVRGGLIPVDLQRAAAGPMVPLTPDADRNIVPAEVIFTNNRGDELSGILDNVERAFVRSTNGELYVLSISLSSRAVLGDTSDMQVLVALENVVTPDAWVHDVELFFGPQGGELLLAAAKDEIILVDGYTGVASRFPQTVAVDHLVRFTDPETGRDMALGFSESSPDYNLLRLDPFGLDERRSTGVEVLRLGSPIVAVDVGHEASRAVVEYADGRDLGVLDLGRGGSVLDLRFARSLSARRLSPAGDKLWLVSVSPEDDAPHLAEVELGDLYTRDVRLDVDGGAVGRVGRYLWVDHGDKAGAITFFPDDELDRDAAMSFRGVLYTDLFNQPVPQRYNEGGQ
ncbi:MAG: hypothetical protein A2289_11355 [Deltaproteobacteria bacterium RIFOXYA12_FULL_58_15]|nr:MAG: hypothetical protein A2289_11355 [Deltaproteobacteria bacterium RIFOXYA12_FULL_58_15]OGR07805.1 MAG: hypothetical protein A2341_07335 [Deltaproteobacteria bacterium RIFOXYB12_FULL_58_9]